jgi:phosphoglucosamine mutase
MKSSELFGTDGLRGLAGQWPLSPVALLQMGFELGRRAKGPVFLGRDTRQSAFWIGDALAAGIQAAGSDIWDMGVCPTPFVARALLRERRGLGVMISASHNPSRDNGIKIFDKNGSKTSRSLEILLEKSLRKKGELSPAASCGKSLERRDLIEEQCEDFDRMFPDLDLSSLNIGIDTAHGALWEIAPRILMAKGARVVQIGADPDGDNINAACGSLFPKALGKVVRRQKLDIGFTFDGDADRCLLLDASGALRDGDAILALFSDTVFPSFTRRFKPYLVGTLMSNGALEPYLKQRGLRLSRSDVGDKYVAARMKRLKAAWGGENSGHIISATHDYIGDACLTMLMILQTLALKKQDLEEALKDYRPWHQELINIEVGKKRPFEKIPKVDRARREVEESLKGRGRLLLRYSGTENLARVMVESASKKLACQAAEHLAGVIEGALRGLRR